MATPNRDDAKVARAAQAAGPPSSRVSRVAHGAPSVSPRRSTREIRESVQHWKRVVRALERQQEADPVRRWLRARSLDIAIRAVAPSDARDAANDLAALGEQVTELLEDLESTIDAGVRRDIETWIDLRHKRDELNRRLFEAWSGVPRAFEERAHRCVREWFAQNLPVPVLAGEPVPAVTSEADAIALLPQAEQAAAIALAACPPKPSRATQEVVTDWPWDPAAMKNEERPLDPATIDRLADEARRAIAILPPAGYQPMWTQARDIPVLYVWIERAWYVAAFAAPIVTLVVVAGIFMPYRAAEDPGFWQPAYAAATIAWLLVGSGLMAKKLVDAVLAKKHAAWVARSAPIDKAHRAIGWQYVVRRAVVEQREAEAQALRDLTSAAARLRQFDTDPDLGQRLFAMRDRHPDLAAHVDATAADFR